MGCLIEDWDVIRHSLNNCNVFIPYPTWKVSVESSTAHTVTMIPGNAQPTIQYLMKVFLMSEACLLVSRTAQNKINLKNVEYILKNCHRHHHNLSYSHCLLVNFGIFKLSLNFLFAFKGSKCLLWIKRRFESHNAQGNISRQYENFKIYKDLYGKSFKRDWMASFSSLTNPSNFRRPLQSLLLRYTAENVQVN